MSSKKLIVIIALLLSGLAAGAAVQEGGRLPDLTKMGLKGTLPATAGKVVLVDFWASWCGPCKQSFPALERLHEKYGKRGLVIVAVSVDEDADAMQEFLDAHPVSFAVVHDAQQRLVEATEVEAMPTSFLIGKDGKVAVVHTGFKGDETEEQIAIEIEGLLK